MSKTNVIKLAANARNLSNQTFGLLTAVAPVGRNNFGNIKWLCICECGNTKTVAGGDLVRRGPKSCGCVTGTTTHGMTGTPEYKIWKSMKGRCLNPTNDAYPSYGGRGIKVSEAWVTDFAQFYADMGPKPEGDYSIERRDNNLGYSADNCSWENRTVQNRNSRHNRMLTFNGKIMCITEWAEFTGIPADPIYRRIYAGWSVERTLTEPVNSH